MSAPTPNASPFLQGALVGALLLAIGYAVGWNAARSSDGWRETRPAGAAVPEEALPRSSRSPAASEGSAERLELPPRRRLEDGSSPEDESPSSKSAIAEEPAVAGKSQEELAVLREALEASRRRESHLLDRALAAEMTAATLKREGSPSAPRVPTAKGLDEDLAAAASRAASAFLGGEEMPAVELQEIGDETLPKGSTGAPAGEVPVSEDGLDLAGLREVLLALGPWPFRGTILAPPGVPREEPREERVVERHADPEEIDAFRRSFQHLLRTEGYTELEITRIQDIDELGLHEPLFRIIEDGGGMRSVIRARRARFYGHARLRTVTMELLDGYEQPTGSDPRPFYQGRRTFTWADVRYAEWVELLARAGGLIEQQEDVELDPKWNVAEVADALNALLDRSRGERGCRLRRVQGVTRDAELLAVELHQYRDRERTRLEVIYEADRAQVSWDPEAERLEFTLIEGFQRRGAQRIPFFEGRCRVYVPLRREALGEEWAAVPRAVPADDSGSAPEATKR